MAPMATVVKGGARGEEQRWPESVARAMESSSEAAVDATVIGEKLYHVRSDSIRPDPIRAQTQPESYSIILER